MLNMGRCGHSSGVDHGWVQKLHVGDEFMAKTSLAMQQLRNFKCHIIVSWKRQPKWYDSRQTVSEIRDAVHDTQAECLQAAFASMPIN